jgi:hypothetical protein
MKALKLIIICAALFFTSTVNAQVQVSVNVGTPPLWGPYGYSAARYYYIPDVESYYDVQTSMFIYNSGGSWVHRAFLPWQYRNYDLYGGYKVVMPDYHGYQPYLFHKACKLKYPKGYNHNHSQKTYGKKSENGNYEGKLQNKDFSNTNKKYNNFNENKKVGQGKYQGNQNKKTEQGSSNKKGNQLNQNHNQKSQGKNNGNGRKK